jgi:short-subunit dehydrogenase
VVEVGGEGNIMKRRVAVVVLSIAIRLFWSLDANPLLWLYDVYATTALTVSSTPEGLDNGTRRIFRSDTTSLEGKTVWITGSSSGIGAELAIQLASTGVGHLILSGRKVEKIKSTANLCLEAHNMMRTTAQHLGKEQNNLVISIVPFDMAGELEVLDEAVTVAMEATHNTGIDVLVLNAGQYYLAPALDATHVEKALPDLMKVNFASPINLALKLIERDQWRQRQHGHIVIISSLMGRGASPMNAVYSASKHAVRGYFTALAAEEKSWLRVDVVLPGAVDTGLWNSSWKSADDTTQLQADDRSKMKVTRCAQLIISSMIGPSYLFWETWITRNPGLLWVFLASFEPITFNFMTKYIIAPFRISMWRENGMDGLYFPDVLRYTWRSLVEYITGRSP